MYLCIIIQTKNFAKMENQTTLTEKAIKLLNSMELAQTLPISDCNYEAQPEHTKELINNGNLIIDKKHRNLVFLHK